MKVNRRFLNWGVFLVAAGGVVLVAQGNSVDSEAVAQALRLWPIAVIALGVGLLLRRTRLGLPAGVLAAAMPGLLLGGLVVAAPQMVPGCGDTWESPGYSIATHHADVTISVKVGSVDVNPMGGCQ
jgi:hypothetical protein